MSLLDRYVFPSPSHHMLEIYLLTDVEMVVLRRRRPSLQTLPRHG